MKALPYLLLSGACTVGAFLLAPRAERHPAELGRPLAAPVMLPFLWGGLVDAIRQGTPEEIVGRGRLVLQLMPTWVDGHLYLAQKMAFEASRRATSVDEALDRLLAALALLEEAGQLCPDHRLEFTLAQAFLVELRCTDQPELGAAHRRRLGVEPLEAAARYLERAERVSQGRHVRAARAYLTKRLIGPALRDGDQARALETLDLAARLLEDVASELRAADRLTAAENAATHQRALMRLRGYLNGQPEIGLDSLLADPYLDEVTRSLRPK